MDPPVVARLGPEHAGDAERLVVEVLGGRLQARLGEVVDVLDLPGFGAWLGGVLAGVATYASSGAAGAELAAIGVAVEHRERGIASALIEAVVAAVADTGGRRLWLVTTNDNLDALALYQRRGFRLEALHAGAVDRAREAKPSIPLLGPSGIPMRDELVLARTVP